MEVMGNDLSRGLFPVKEVKLLNSLRCALLLVMSLANRFKDFSIYGPPPLIFPSKFHS